MKRRGFLALALIALTSLTGCSKDANKTQGSLSHSSLKGSPEIDTIRWNCGTSGNVLLTVGDHMGYFEDEGLKIELISADANADAMALLASGQVDIVSNAGTSNPLQQIASGVDLTIFGGHMVTGCMPVIAKKNTSWNGPQDLIGKKFACSPSYFAFTGALMDLGYKDPLNEVNWVSYTDYNDALAAVVRGEVDYALMGTGQNYTVENMPEVEIMCYQSDVMPNYSCCRMESKTEFLNNNPIAVKLLLKALLRSQAYYEANKNESVKLHASKIGADIDYVAAYMLNEHYVVSVDPLKDAVARAWNILDATGFLNENAKNTDISNHVNTSIYEKALNEIAAERGDEDSEFYTGMQTFYKKNNT